MTDTREPTKAPAPGGLIWNLGSALLPLVGSFLVSLLIAPHLGPEGFGHYTTAMSAATLILIAAKFGVHSATSRLLTENESEGGRWLRAGLLLRTAFTLPLALLCLLLGPPLARSLGGEALVRPFWLLGPIVLAASYYEFGGEALIGLRRFPRLFANRMLFLLLRLGAIAWVRLAALGSTAFLTGHAVAQSLPALLLLVELWRRLPLGEAERARGALRRTWELSLPLAFGSASYLIYAHTDRLMLAWFRDQATVGQFGVARNVLDASIFPLTALAWTLRPALVRAVDSGDRERLATVLAHGLRMSLLFAVGAPALMGVFGVPMVTGLYGDAYAEAARLLAWMLPILFLRGVGAVLFPALLALDAQGTYARLMVLTAGANVVANLLLIPRYGAVGAVWATVAALLPLTVGGFAKVRSAAGTLPLGRCRAAHLRAVAVAAAVAWLGLRWWPEEASLPLLLGGALGAAVLVMALGLGRDGWKLPDD